MIKQVIVVRKDLNMRKGKIAAQVAHASMKVWFDRMKISHYFNEIKYITENLSEEFVAWKEGDFTKIVLCVDSEKELLEICNKAIGKSLPCALIEDNGLTEFNGVKTKTCVAIGPCQSEYIDEITGHLKLL